MKKKHYKKIDDPKIVKFESEKSKIQGINVCWLVTIYKNPSLFHFKSVLSCWLRQHVKIYFCPDCDINMQHNGKYALFFILQRRPTAVGRKLTKSNEGSYL